MRHRFASGSAELKGPAGTLHLYRGKLFTPVIANTSRRDHAHRQGRATAGAFAPGGTGEGHSQ